MNHCVPEFESEDDYLFPTSSNLKRHKKSAMGDEDIMELLWQNDQVVMQNYNQRSVTNRKTDDGTTPCNMFMQKDEMVSWLHYPNEDNNLDLYLHNNDIFPITTAVGAGDLSTQPPPPSITVPSPRPPIAPVKRSENFLHFSRPNNKNLPESAPVNSNTMTQSTGVGSNDRPLQAKMNYYGGAGTSSAGREPETYDISESSSPGTGGSGASASVEPSLTQKAPPVIEDRKRKGRYTDDTECYSEDVEFEYDDGKKQSGGSRSTKRTRAAEVHNLSERRRRDRINEKMKALQELIPRCNKSDKASMLNEAIEYLKSLQMQVQMMSMGYGMVPMMFPGVQRYMPTMAVAAMGMGMGMDQVGMNRPIVPYPTVLPGSAMLNPAAAAPHLAPRFPIPRFQMAQVPLMGPIRGQPPIPSDNPMMNPFPIQNANQPQMVPFADPYQQQYIGLPQTQLPQPQNQAVMPAITRKQSSSKDVRNPEHHPTGKISPRLDNIHEYNQRLQYGGQPILLPLQADV